MGRQEINDARIATDKLNRIYPDPSKIFQQILNGAGFELPCSVTTTTDKPFRCEVKGSIDKPGWYHFKLFRTHSGSDIGYGYYGDWRDGATNSWSSANDAEMDPRDIERFKAEQKESKAEAKRALAERQDKTAEVAEEFIKGAAVATDHPYLQDKGIKPHGIRERNGDLLVPMHDSTGDVRSYQRIKADGTKRYLKDGQKNGLYYLIGTVDKLVYIVEGFATGATVHELTGEAVAVAFDTSGLKPALAELRKVHKGLVVFAADNDESGIGEKKAREAASGAPLCSVIIPRFKAGSGTDFNDLASIDLELAKEQLLEGANLQSQFFADMFDASDFDSSAIPLRDFVYAELLLGGYVTVCAGPGGTGKSVLSIVMAVSVALGRELIPGYKMKRARNVLMLNNEDDKYELQRRITAVCACYDIDLRELENRLWVRSGYSYPAMVASIGPDKRVKATPEVELIIDFCKANHVDLIICDPFISTHNVNENDNVEMNMVVQIFKHICAQTNAAVLLIAHTKKLGRDTEAGAGDPESGRGASSVKDAGRITFTLARMSREHAKVRGITWQIANNLVRMDDGKKNLTPMDPDTKWFRLTEAIIPNGEKVGVPVLFDVEAISKAKDKPEGMTAERWAREIETVLDAGQTNSPEFKYKDIHERLKASTNYGSSSVSSFASLLSTEPDKPTTFDLDGKLVEYWASKGPSQTSPWLVHRKVS